MTISHQIYYMYTFGCTFDLLAFPFDLQVCNLTFELKENTGGCKPQWSAVNSIVGKRQNISMYFVEELRYFVHTNANNISHLNVVLLLTRRYDSYLYTTFLPCIILCVLGALTMIFFRIDDFSDRITVTLSLLIVVASLFSQMVSTIPQSPAPKCVEIFFFYIIIRLSFVFILHTLTDFISYRTKMKKKSSNGQTEDSKGETGVVDASLVVRKKNSWLYENPKTDTMQCEDSEAEAPRCAFLINRIGWHVGFVVDVVFCAYLIVVVVMNRREKWNEYISRLKS